VMILINMGKSS